MIVRTLKCAAFVLLGLTAPALVGADDPLFTQLSEVMPTSAAEVPPAADRSDRYQGSPSPQWIWGEDNNAKYLLTKEFSAKSVKSAWLQASCDNRFSIRLNGNAVGGSSEWQEPIEVDVSKLAKTGTNVLEAEVENQGGSSGFVAQLVVVDGDGKKAFVVSDDSWVATKADASKANSKIKTHGKLGVQPWGNVFEGKQGGTSNLFATLPGFQVERLFTVPKDQLGSWVCLAVDPQGRLIVSDQGDKGLCRVTPAPIGSKEPTKVERLDLKITSAQGLLFAFDSLYISVNGGPGSGLYRARDTNKDDTFDELTKLKEFRGGGEHGPHALRLSPDGKHVVVICGNHTQPPFQPAEQAEHPEYRSRIPTNWSEDHLLPRQWDANGHARGVLAPGGWIAQTDPEGKSWEILSMGYRNPYDMDFDREGDLFAYDADMEWDIGSPWYRPTRVVHATSGSEFGWRSGTGKWPTYYPDSLPPVVDVGPGSPVGAEFGFGSKFPAKYQRALYICDWTFGTMYAIHLQPQGSTYVGVKEEFVSRSPLPLTDVAIGKDGAMYFTVGGRGTQSELFRVTYTGSESVSPVGTEKDEFFPLRQLRRELEAYHSQPVAELKANAATILPRLLEHLGHSDQAIRYAARIALERIPVELWQEKVLALTEPQAAIHGMIALARQGKPESGSRAAGVLLGMKLDQLDQQTQLNWHRALQLVFIRLGAPEESVRQKTLALLEPRFPLDSKKSAPTAEDSASTWVYETGFNAADYLNREVLQMLVYLNSTQAVAKTIPLLEQASQQRGGQLGALLERNQGYGKAILAMIQNQPDLQQMSYAFTLRNAKEGWTNEQKLAYFRWYQKAHTWSGGASFQKFLDNMSNDAYDNSTDSQRLIVEASGLRQAYQTPELPKAIGPGKAWTMDEVMSLAQSGLTGRNYKNGERAFGAARCVVCHRFVGQGGATGPDLTQAAGRFQLKDLVEAIVEPSKVISDQYRATQIVTDGGQVIVGRLLSETDSQVTILVDPENSSKVREIPREEIDSLQPSKVSLMPAELINSLNQNEVLDLLAYLLSRGDATSPMFKK